MTEFEFLYLLKEMEDAMWMHIMNFISIIFTMLVSAYFIGAKLTKLMTAALLSLFSLGALLFFSSAITSRQDYVTLATAARKTLKAETSQVPSLAMFDAPAATVVGMDVLLYVILVFAYVSTMVFFFQARKQGATSLSFDVSSE